MVLYTLPENGHSIPADDNKHSTFLDLSKVEVVGKLIRECFHLSTDGCTHPRMDASVNSQTDGQPKNIMPPAACAACTEE